MPEILPAIIPKSFKDLESQMSKVAGLVSTVQIDVMDGKLTPEASWPYGSSSDADFNALKREEVEFPFWQKLDFEVDLMVKNPQNIWFDWIILGAKRVIFHIESFDSAESLESLIKDFKEKLPAKDSALYIELGLAIDIDTSNGKIYPFIPEIDFVQCMGIAKIGFQGEPFDERVIEKIKDLRGKYPELVISVDGGVSLETAPSLIEAGANRLAVGSAIFGSEDIKGTIEEFRNIST